MVFAHAFITLGGTTIGLPRQWQRNGGEPGGRGDVSLTKGLKELEEFLELVQDNEVGLHHAKPEPPEALAEVLDSCELLA